MKTLALWLSLGCVSLFPMNAVAAGGSGASDNKDADTYVYADFEDMKDGRPVSKHGGRIQLTAYAENQAATGKFGGIEGANPPAPELVHLDPNNANKAAMFHYELLTPNAYAGVSLEIEGHEPQDGKVPPDDLSAYKTLSVQAFAEGVTGMRVEIFSVGTGLTKGNDSDTVSGFPQKVFKLSPGLNTYKIKLDTLKQPGWQSAFRVGEKEVMAKLTAVHFAVFCEGACALTQGRVVIDNVVFEK